MEKNEIRVTSWLSLPLHQLDFGFGKPTFITRASECSRGNFYLASNGDGGVTVMASMEPETMPLFKEMFYKDLGREDGEL
jgi:shikimate O-hydroxycinnamoyltransferase